MAAAPEDSGDEPSASMGTVIVDNYEDAMRTPLPTSMLTKSSISLNPAYSPSSPSPLRFWRPAAQRNIKNQWSKIRATKDHWVSASSKGRSHATNLVNAYLERRYMPDWNLGVLTDMPKIRGEACNKLSYNQELCRKKLVSSYMDMVVAVKDLVKASCSMRCYLKESGSNTIIQFSDHQGNPNDYGDGGGIPVFSCLSITHFEDLACELVDMFRQELSLKRFLVIALRSMNCGEDEGIDDVFCWSNELYHGEFVDLASSGMLIQDSYPIPPQLKGEEPSDPLNDATIMSTNHKTLEVYLTTWLVDLNIEEQRVIEIFCIVEEEMKAKAEMIHCKERGALAHRLGCCRVTFESRKQPLAKLQGKIYVHFTLVVGPFPGPSLLGDTGLPIVQCKENSMYMSARQA